MRKCFAYLTGSQDSRSNPLCIDWAMEDSIRSTYLTTRGANRSCRCLWNFPLHRLSEAAKIKSGKERKNRMNDCWHLVVTAENVWISKSEKWRWQNIKVLWHFQQDTCCSKAWLFLLISGDQTKYYMSDFWFIMVAMFTTNNNTKMYYIYIYIYIYIWMTKHNSHSISISLTISLVVLKVDHSQ